jgi:hypothetical protein
MSAISLKRKELYILLIIGLFLVIFVQFFLGIGGVFWVSFSVLIGLIGLFLLFGGTVKWKLLSYCFFISLLLEGVF